MNRMRIYILLSSIVWMSAVVTAQDLGLTKITNWLKFPPDEHPGWNWETVAGVDFDSQGNLYISSRGGTAPPLTVWKPDGTLLRVFPGPKVRTWDHYVEIDINTGEVLGYQEGGFNNAHSIAMDPVSGNLVCGYHQGHVERFRVLATTGVVDLFQNRLHTCPAQK